MVPEIEKVSEVECGEPIRCGTARDEAEHNFQQQIESRTKDVSLVRAEFANQPERESLREQSASGSVASSDVSVIIVTFNSEKTVERTMRSLLKQSVLPREVIVIDGGSSDGTLQVVNRMKEVALLPIILVSKVHGSRGYCRNVGLEHSSGDIIAFLDSDCEAPLDWLSNLISTLRKPGSHVKGVGGPYVPPADSHSFSNTTYHLLGASTGRLTAQFLRKEDNEKHVVTMPGGNCAFEKSALLEAGGFDPKLDYCEDADLSGKVSALGHRLLFVPSTFVYHDWKGWKGLLQLALAGANYGKGRAIASRVKSSLFPSGYMSLLFLLAIGTLTELSLIILSPYYLVLPLLTAVSYLAFCFLIMLRHKTFDAKAVLSPIVFLLSYGFGILSGMLEAKRSIP